MYITHLLHSCLLVEEKDKAVLIDPGEYTDQAGIMTQSNLSHLDTILITHEHFDHFSLPLVTSLHKKFPEAVIISTPSVVRKLKHEGISATEKETVDIALEPVTHEEILFASVPENNKFTVFNRLTHPGDSYQFASGTEILAMPMIAPWGSLVEAMKKIIEVKPKLVIPIHDWHWKDEAKEAFYPRVTDYLKEYDIVFKPLTPGERTEV